MEVPSGVHQLKEIKSPKDAPFLDPDKREFSVNIFDRTVYKFHYIETLDLAEFPKGSILQVPKLDVSNSKQFSYTNRGVVEKLSNKKYVSSLIDEPKKDIRITKYLKEILTTKTLTPVTQSDIDSDYLYHGGGITYTREEWNLGRSPINKIGVMKKNGIHGAKNRVTYVTNRFESAFAHSPREKGSEILFLIISTSKLMGMRNIFIDPESLTMNDEFMKHFVVPNGIPVSAIEGAFILKSDGEIKKT